MKSSKHTSENCPHKPKKIVKGREEREMEEKCRDCLNFRSRLQECGDEECNPLPYGEWDFCDQCGLEKKVSELRLCDVGVLCLECLTLFKDKEGL